jgi:uncharacterized membrane protein
LLEVRQELRILKTTILAAWGILWHLFFRASGFSEAPVQLAINLGMSILLAFGTTAVTISVLAMLLPKKARYNVDPVILLAVLSSICGLLFGFVNNSSLPSIKRSIEYYGAGTTPAELAVYQHYCDLLGFLSVVLNLSGYAFLIFSLLLIVFLVVRVKSKDQKVFSLSRLEKIAGCTALVGWLHFGLSGQLFWGLGRVFCEPDCSVAYPTAKTVLLLAPLLLLNLFMSWRQITVPKAKPELESEETPEEAGKRWPDISTILKEANRPAFILALLNLFLLSGLSLYKTTKFRHICPTCPSTASDISIPAAGAVTAAVLLVLSLFSRRSRLINLFAILSTLAGSGFAFYLLIFQIRAMEHFCWGCMIVTMIFFGLLYAFIKDAFSVLKVSEKER